MTDIIDISYIYGHHIMIQYGKESGFDLYVIRSKDNMTLFKKHYKTYKGAKTRYIEECSRYRTKEREQIGLTKKGEN